MSADSATGSSVRRARIMTTLDHLGAFAPLLLQLERWLEEVHIKPCRRVEPSHRARRVGSILRLIASATRLLSRLTSGRHSVHPVSSHHCRVWMNEPAVDVPPCGTMSTSQKPAGGSFQSLNVGSAPHNGPQSKRRPGADGRLPHNLHVAKHSVDRRCAHREQSRLLALAELQPAVSRQRWHKSGPSLPAGLAASTSTPPIGPSALS
jgi:hypothetical protein